MIKAKDPRLRRISVAYEGFLVPEGIPLPENTQHTEALPVASLAGSSSPSPYVPQVKEEEEVDREGEGLADQSSANEDFEVFDLVTPSPTATEDMGIQRKPQRSLQELLESQPGRGEAGRSTQQRLPPPPPKSPLPAPQPAPPSRAEQPEPKRRREPKGKEVVEAGRTQSSHDEDVPRPTKQLKIGPAPSRGLEMGEIQQNEPRAWLPAPMLGGEPLTDDASIRDYNGGVGCHVASALEETLLLPKDMVELRGLRRSEVFLQAKRCLGMVRTITLSLIVLLFFISAMCHLFRWYSKSSFLFGKQAVQSTFRMEEIYHSVAQQLEEERRRRMAAVQTMSIAEKSNADLKERVKTEEQAKKSAESALKGAETQAESQRKVLLEVKGQLVTAKEQIATLRQQLDEANKLKELADKAKMQAEEDKLKAEKERDEAEQHGYDVGVAETEDTLRAEVPSVCRAYCVHTWEEALNQAGVVASSGLRRPESIIFPLALQLPKQTEPTPLAPQPAAEASAQPLPSAAQPDQGKEKEVQQGPLSGEVTKAPQPGTASQDFEKQLALVTLPAQEPLEDKEKEINPEAADQASKPKLQIKLKP